MTHTKQELAEEVMLELGLADASDPAEDQESIAFVKRRYESAFQELDDKDLVFWDEDAIDVRAFIPLAKHVAFACKERFGVRNYDPRDENGKTPLQRLQALAGDNDRQFRTQAEYF